MKFKAIYAHIKEMYFAKFQIYKVSIFIKNVVYKITF